ncbi:MAG: hypothetical protein ACRDIY_00300 [Chloroflexota bacterium]
MRHEQTGMRGSALHEHLVDLARFDLHTRLRQRGYLWAASQSPELIPEQFGPRQYADAILWSEMARPDGEPTTTSEPVYPPIVVEVGEFNPEKWPTWLPVLHVAFNGRVSLVNPTGRKFEEIVREEMLALCAER